MECVFVHAYIRRIPRTISPIPQFHRGVISIGKLLSKPHKKLTRPLTRWPERAVSTRGYPRAPSATERRAERWASGESDEAPRTLLGVRGQRKLPSPSQSLSRPFPFHLHFTPILLFLLMPCLCLSPSASLPFAPLFSAHNFSICSSVRFLSCVYLSKGLASTFPPPCPLTSGLPNERNHTHFPSARERCSTELRREDREQMNMAFLCNLPMFNRSFWSCTMFSLMGPHIH